eukprot:g1759.t1
MDEPKAKDCNILKHVKTGSKLNRKGTKRSGAVRSRPVSISKLRSRDKAPRSPKSSTVAKRCSSSKSQLSVPSLKRILEKVNKSSDNFGLLLKLFQGSLNSLERILSENTNLSQEDEKRENTISTESSEEENILLKIIFTCLTNLSNLISRLGTLKENKSPEGKTPYQQKLLKCWALLFTLCTKHDQIQVKCCLSRIDSVRRLFPSLVIDVKGKQNSLYDPITLRLVLSILFSYLRVALARATAKKTYYPAPNDHDDLLQYSNLDLIDNIEKSCRNECLPYLTILQGCSKADETLAYKQGDYIARVLSQAIVLQQDQLREQLTTTTEKDKGGLITNHYRRQPSSLVGLEGGGQSCNEESVNHKLRLFTNVISLSGVYLLFIGNFLPRPRRQTDDSSTNSNSDDVVLKHIRDTIRSVRSLWLEMEKSNKHISLPHHPLRVEISRKLITFCCIGYFLMMKANEDMQNDFVSLFSKLVIMSSDKSGNCDEGSIVHLALASIRKNPTRTSTGTSTGTSKGTFKGTSKGTSTRTSTGNSKEKHKKTPTTITTINNLCEITRPVLTILATSITKGAPECTTNVIIALYSHLRKIISELPTTTTLTSKPKAKTVFKIDIASLLGIQTAALFLNNNASSTKRTSSTPVDEQENSSEASDDVIIAKSLQFSDFILKLHREFILKLHVSSSSLPHHLSPSSFLSLSTVKTIHKYSKVAHLNLAKKKASAKNKENTKEVSKHLLNFLLTFAHVQTIASGKEDGQEKKEKLKLLENQTYSLIFHQAIAEKGLLQQAIEFLIDKGCLSCTDLMHRFGMKLYKSQDYVKSIYLLAGACVLMLLRRREHQAQIIHLEDQKMQRRDQDLQLGDQELQQEDQTIQLQCVIAKMQKRLVELTQQAVDRMSLNEQAEGLQEEILKLQTQVQKLQKQLKAEMTMRRKENEEKERNEKFLRGQIQALETDNTTLQREVSKWKKKYQDARAESQLAHSELEDKYRRSSSLCEAQRSELEERQKQLTSLRKELLNLRKREEEANADQLSNLNDEISILRKQLSTQRANAEKERQYIEDGWKDKLKSLEGEMAHLKVQHKKEYEIAMEDSRGNIERLLSEMSDLQAENVTLKGKITKLRSKAANASAKNASMEDMRRNVQDKLKEYKEKVEAYSQELEQASRNSKSSSASARSLKVKLQKLESTVKEKEESYNQLSEGVTLVFSLLSKLETAVKDECKASGYLCNLEVLLRAAEVSNIEQTLKFNKEQIAHLKQVIQVLVFNVSSAEKQIAKYDSGAARKQAQLAKNRDLRKKILLELEEVRTQIQQNPDNIK